MNNALEPFRGDRVDALIAEFAPVIDSLLDRIDVDEFITPDFIAAMLTDPEANAVYHHAISVWGEDEHSSKLVIHGQVIPGALRANPRVEWAGFAHGEPDEFAVPAWWRMKRDGE